MARTATNTAVNLDRYAVILGLSLVHFNHLRDDAPPSTGRAFWNQDHHDQLAEALAGAEAMLQAELGFDVAPRYRSGEEIAFNPPQRARVPRLRGLSGPNFGIWEDELLAQAWQQTTVRAGNGYLVAFGTEVRTLVEAAEEVVYAGDTGTVTVSGIGTTDPAAVGVFYRTEDGAQEAGTDAWRIRGVAVSITEGVATISGPKAVFVLPAVLAGDEPGEYADAENFVEAVQVYRVETDPETPITVHWNYTQGEGGDPSVTKTDTAVGQITDPVYGDFRVRTASYSGGVHREKYPAHSGVPSRFTVNYLAGYPLVESGGVHPLLEQAVIRLANTLLPEPFHWLLDAAKTWRDDREPVPPEVLGELGLSPFGATRGAYHAWAVAQQIKRKGVRFA